MSRQSSFKRLTDRLPTSSSLSSATSVWTTRWHFVFSAIFSIVTLGDEDLQNVLLAQFRRDKKIEYQYVSFAGTVISAAVVGSLSWARLADAHWFVSAAWYGSLLYSLISVVFAFHLSQLLSSYDSHPDGSRMAINMVSAENSRTGVSYISVFILQAPYMMLSYAILSYIVGLFLLVVRPLWNKPWSDDSKIAITFISYTAPGVLAYLVIVFYVYRKGRPVLKQVSTARAELAEMEKPVRNGNGNGNGTHPRETEVDVLPARVTT